jgi:hypothetical protein
VRASSRSETRASAGVRRELVVSLAVALLLAGSFWLSACGAPSRSVAAYCSYFYGEGSKLRQRELQNNDATGQDPFAELANVFADLPEAAAFLYQLSLRAPESIAPDVQVLANALQQTSQQSGGSGLGLLASGLLNGLAATGAEQRVNQFTEQHCRRPPA